MVCVAVLIFGVLWTNVCNAAKTTKTMVAGSMSPDRGIVIVEERDADGERYYFFRDLRSRKKIGYVLPPKRESTNVAIVTSWNRRSSKVALLLFYGTKLSMLRLFTRDSEGTMQSVEWEVPEALKIYQERTVHTIPQVGDGHDVNAVGPWLDDDTVALVSGSDKQTEDPNEYMHVYVTFRARIRGTRAEISQLKLVGPFGNAGHERFVRNWGPLYFQATD